MNTRQLSQGLVPTVEYERQHAYKSFRQFPELRLSAKEVEDMKLRKHREMGSMIRTPLMHKSTHRLAELSRSSLDDVSTVMTDYRRILLDNRRAASTGSSILTAPSQDDVSELSDPLERADAQLTKISIAFDSQSYNSHLAGFQGSKVDKNQFDVLLRRCLNIRLRRAELDALFLKMDVDGSALIDGVEFIRYFFALGNAARWKIQLETVNIRSKKLEVLKRRRADEEQRIKDWEAGQIANYTNHDVDTAFRKLQHLTLSWNALSEVDVCYLQGFDMMLTPYQFKIQMTKGIGGRLSGAEIAALISVFQTAGAGEQSVDGRAFIRKFHELRREEARAQAQMLASLGDKKKKVMSMGQNVDFLPKCLGR